MISKQQELGQAFFLKSTTGLFGKTSLIFIKICQNTTQLCLLGG
jgi:hypothetical protein